MEGKDGPGVDALEGLILSLEGCQGCCGPEEGRDWEYVLTQQSFIYILLCMIHVLKQDGERVPVPSLVYS